jgi:nicotinate-nucleotide adenylyltransferase
LLLAGEESWVGNIPKWGDRRKLRVGLLGGSFNPAHAGHIHVARTAMRRLRLDQIWLLVSPGNPLKPRAGMAPPEIRLASARKLADGRRIIATDIERHLGTRYTHDTLRALRRRFPRVTFVWIMGADNLIQMPRWHRWAELARTTKIAVLPRPAYTHHALSSQAAQRLRHARVAASRAASLTAMPDPAWVFLQGRQNMLSATALRGAHNLFAGDAS